VAAHGKLLGGSTSHNGLVFNRGNPSDFNQWARLTKDPGWKYENLIKYFEKSEKYIGAYDNLGEWNPGS
jgi:choline dehydrogenase